MVPPEPAPSSPPASVAPSRSNYLALPSRDLGFLKNTLRLYLREDKVAEVILAFGARCGAGQVLQSQVEVSSEDELGELIPVISAQIGLAKIKTRAQGPDHLILELTRLAEGVPGTPIAGRLEFTRGFLEGAVTQLLHCRVVGRSLPEEAGTSAAAVVELRWTAGAPTFAPPRSPPGAPIRGTAPPGKKGLAAGAYLVEEKEGVDALELFVREAAQHGGLAFTAERGKELRGRKELNRATIYDLVPRESQGLLTQEAGNLPGLLGTVDEFVKRNPRGVVLVTDLPLLLGANGVEPTRNFLSIVAEMLAEGKGSLFVAAPAGGLPSGERSLLQRVLKLYAP